MKKIVTILAICGLAQFAFSQNFGIDQPNPTQKLDVNGNMKIGDNISVEGNSDCRIYRNLVTYSAGSGAAGAFVVTTSHLWNANCMFKINVEGYFYDASGPYDLMVGGYMYSNNSFYNYGYINTGGKKLEVRLARSPSNTIALILGNEAASYPYPKLTVTDYLQGYNNINESYADGWSISQETSLAGYSYITTVPEVTSSGPPLVIKKGQYTLVSGIAYHQTTPTNTYTIPVTLPANTKAIYIAVYYAHTGSTNHGYLNFDAYQQGATASDDKTTFINQHYNDYYNTDYYEQMVPWNNSGSGNAVTIQVTNSYYTGGGTYTIYYTGYLAAN